MTKQPPIRLLVFDIDGVLTAGEAQALDLDLLQALAELNQVARKNPQKPAVTLCTGRPAPYVEMMLQAIDGHLPGVFENGAGLYVPENYRFLPHPDIDHSNRMHMVRDRLENRLVSRGAAYFQPGKEYSLTLFASDPRETNRLQRMAESALGEIKDTVDLVYSSSCLNILAKGIHKGKGIEFLSRHTGYRTGEMLGVGDSDVDLPFLERVGHRAAPENANRAVKALADYVSPLPTGEGVRDILRHFGIW